MAKAIPVEDKLANLSALDLRSPAAEDQLRCALKDKSNLVVARAANQAAKGELKSLSDELATAFGRLLAGGMHADRGCYGKQAIAHALYQFGTGSAELFLAGIHHVQMEPVFGGEADTAPELRGTCALGLVRVGHRDALAELSDLLGDPEPQARIMAARALAYSGSEFAALPLRVKIRGGDDSPEVMGECFTALLRLTPGPAVTLIGRYLQSKERDLATEAAMALASCRLASAGDLLLAAWDARPLPEHRELLLGPLAITRRPEAIDLLIHTIERSGASLACGAVEALAIYKSDPEIRARVLQAASTRDRDVQSAANKAFPR